MWIVLLTFLLCFTIIYGLYYTVVERPEVGSREALRSRLKKAPALKLATAGLVKTTTSTSSIPVVEAILARAGSVTDGLQKLIDSADVKISVGRLVVGSALLGVVAYFICVMLFHREGLALLAAPIFAAAPYYWLRYKRKARLTLFEEQFPDAIDLIARAMRAGHGLTAGLGMVGEEVPAPVGKEFKLIYDWQNFGMALPEALQRFAERTPVLDARFFVTAVLTQRESGGNLSEVLDNLARVIRDRFRVKRQIRVISAHGRLTAMVLGAMPPVLAAYFLVRFPDYLQSMLEDTLGVQMLVGAVVMQIIGVLIIRKLIDIEY